MAGGGGGGGTEFRVCTKRDRLSTTEDCWCYNRVARNCYMVAIDVAGTKLELINEKKFLDLANLDACN